MVVNALGVVNQSSRPTAGSLASSLINELLHQAPGRPAPRRWPAGRDRPVRRSKLSPGLAVTVVYPVPIKQEVEGGVNGPSCGGRPDGVHRPGRPAVRSCILSRVRVPVASALQQHGGHLGGTTDGRVKGVHSQPEGSPPRGRMSLDAEFGLPDPVAAYPRAAVTTITRRRGRDPGQRVILRARAVSANPLTPGRALAMGRGGVKPSPGPRGGGQ